MCQAARFAESTDNAIWTNQFDNTANKRAHIETTGPEIWQDTSEYHILFLELPHNDTVLLAPWTVTCAIVKAPWREMSCLLPLIADGKVDAVTFSTGTGGTLAGEWFCLNTFLTSAALSQVVQSCQHCTGCAELPTLHWLCIAGVGTYLKEKNKNIQVVLADPQVWFVSEGCMYQTKYLRYSPFLESFCTFTALLLCMHNR